MLMMDAWNTSYKFLNQDDRSWERMMRANACEGAREGFTGRATEGVWSSLISLVVEPVFRGSGLLKKNCHGGN